MKYRCFPFLFGLLLLSFVLHAEQNIIPSYKQLDPIQVTQSPNVRWRLFPTQNMYTFLQLDTSTGLIVQLHFSAGEKGFTGLLPLNGKNLANGEKETLGRFTLYPTQNMYTFILLDQIRGFSWRVQWNHDEKYRFCIPLYVPQEQ